MKKVEQPSKLTFKRGHKKSSRSKAHKQDRTIANRALRRVAKRDPESAPEKTGHLGHEY